MEEINLKIGRINRRIEKTIGHDFGPDVAVYLSNASLDELAAKWPSTYLGRIEEMGRILISPDYASYSAERKTLFLIKEYLRNGHFCKVVMEIEEQDTLSMKHLSNLTEDVRLKIDRESLIKRVD